MLDMSAVASRLRRARESAGFQTATDAASRFAWKSPTYLSHENGSRGITPEAVLAYARAFRVKPEWILFGSGDGIVSAVNETTNEGTALIPVYDLAATAGRGAMIESESIAYSMAFPPGYLGTLRLRTRGICRS